MINANKPNYHHHYQHNITNTLLSITLTVHCTHRRPVLYSLITKHLTKTSGYEHNAPAPSRSTKLPASPHSTDRYEQNNHHHHHEGHRSSTSPSRAKVGGPAPSKQYPIIRNGIMKNGTTSATSGPDKSRDTIPRSSTENATRSHLTVTSNRLAPAQTPPTDSGHRCQTQQRLQQQETVSTKQQAASRSSASGRERRSYDQDHDDDDDDLKSRKSTAATSYNNTSPSDTTTSRTSNRDAEHSRTSNRDVEHSRTSNSDASDRYRGSSNRDSAERSWTSSRDADRLRRSKDSRPESPFTAERNYIVEELAKLSNSDDVYDEESYIVTGYYYLVRSSTIYIVR